jgi:hypothetical protein
VGFVDDVFGKSSAEVGVPDLEALIQRRREEDQNLEYKGARVLGSPEQLSKSLSAFLNAEGGLLIVGISQQNPSDEDRLSAKIYPAGLELAEASFTSERVSQSVHSNIRSDVTPVILVQTVRDRDGRGAFLLDVPKGNIPPYQAADGKYYRRINSTRSHLRHYEIADFFNRRQSPELVLLVDFHNCSVIGERFKFGMRFFVANRGRASARFPQFSISFSGAEITTGSRNIERLDTLRQKPSFQWGDNVGVIHARANTRVHVANVQVYKDGDWPLTIEWNIVADGMVERSGNFQFDSETSIRDLAEQREPLELVPFD